MKRTLAVVIDANRVTCGKCHQHLPAPGRPWSHCCQFHVALKHDARGPLRCAPCLAAEMAK